MKIILTIVLFFGSSISLFAQLSFTSFPLSSQSTNVKSLSLGNATVSLSGDFIGESLNPAGIGSEGILHLSPNYSQFEQHLRIGWDHIKLNANYGFRNSAIGFTIQHIQTGEQLTTSDYFTGFIQKFNNQELFLSAGYSYHLLDGLSIGGALNYLYSGESPATSITYQQIEAVDTWSLDLGLRYQFSEIQLNQLLISPNTGITLNNFGWPVKYTESDPNYPLPTKLQVGAGIHIKSTKTVLNRSIIELTVVQNISKIFARIEQKGVGSQVNYDAMNPFKALTKSWGAYQYFDGRKYQTVNPIEQIWWHTGVGFNLLETLSVRWGYQNAGGIDDPFTFISKGMGLDFFYIVFDYSYISSKDANYLNGHHWQITGRIPLNGQRPDTILKYLFN